MYQVPTQKTMSIFFKFLLSNMLIKYSMYFKNVL